jgi:hypothetical protein
VVREQLQAFSQLMVKQLEVLRGGLPAEEPAPAAPAPLPAVAQAPAAPAPAAEFNPFAPYKPVQRGPVGRLTERQTQYLEGFVRRYTERTRRSKEFTQAHRRALADPRVGAGFRAPWKEMVYPIVTERSRGSRLWDMDGNEYIDLLNGFGPILFVHAPPFVAEAVASQPFSRSMQSLQRRVGARVNFLLRSDRAREGSPRGS